MLIRTTHLVRERERNSIVVIVEELSNEKARRQV